MRSTVRRRGSFLLHGDGYVMQECRRRSVLLASVVSFETEVRKSFRGKELCRACLWPLFYPALSVLSSCFIPFPCHFVLPTGGCRKPGIQTRALVPTRKGSSASPLPPFLLFCLSSFDRPIVGWSLCFLVRKCTSALYSRYLRRFFRLQYFKCFLILQMFFRLFCLGENVFFGHLLQLWTADAVFVCAYGSFALHFIV